MKTSTIDLFDKNKNKNKSTTSVEEYIQHIYSTCENSIPNVKMNGKIADDNICIPTIRTYDLLFENNYNVTQLKMFAKQYKLKMSGNKNQLISRIYIFLKLSAKIVIIQKIIRGRLQRKCNSLHGPAFLNRTICTNDRDFLTDDILKDITYTQFFSYKDVDDFVYGFDIISLYNLIVKSGRNIKNPYNRNDIQPKVVIDMRNLIRISKILNIYIDVEIKDVSEDITPQQSMDLRVLELFQNINALGNYSDAAWFMSLSRPAIIKLLRELMDIWTYRAQLSNEVKRLICPPYGDPFRNINFNYIAQEINLDRVRMSVLHVLEKFVNSGADTDNKSLGAYYVLGALTLVNENAATSLPWLFQSVSYY
jgi:hypothetical protein